MALDLDYITWIRKELPAYDALNMLHLHELGVGWYRLHDIADHFSTHRSNINASMLRLRKKGLIEYESYGSGGTFLWWVKSSVEDRPNRGRDFPRWVLRHVSEDRTTQIRLGQQASWAAAHCVSPGTLRNFLSGRQRMLLGQWVIQSSPLSKSMREVA